MHATAESRLQRYEAIFESAVDFAILATDRAGLITDWNTGAEMMFGWSAAEMIGGPADRFFVPEDRADGCVAREMSRTLETGRGSDERWHLRRDGSRFWANGEMMPLRDPDGRHSGFLKIVRDETARRQDAERRQTQQDFINNVLAASDDCIKVLDLEAKLVFMSEGGRRVMEVEDFEAIRSCPWPDFWQGDLHTKAEAAVVAAKAGRTSHFQGVTSTFKGTSKWWDVRVTPILDRHGAPETLLAISRDITAEKQAATKLSALLDLGDRLRDGASRPDMAFAAAEILGRTLGVERAGYASVDLAGEIVTVERDWTAPGLASLAGPHRFRDYGSYVEDLRKGHTVVLADALSDARTADRSEALEAISARTLVNVPTMENGGLAAICFVAQSTPRRWTEQDIGFVREVVDRTHAAIQRRRAEDALRQLAASLEAEVALRTADRNRIWQLSTDIMLVCGFDGVITAVNPAWDAMLGWSERDLLGRSLFDLIHPDDLQHTLAGAQGLADGQSLAQFENRYRHKDGSYRTISWMAVPGGGAINAVGRDMTEEALRAEALRHAEDQLRQSQKMEAVGQLTGGVAHDFNNLLTVIRSSVDLLRRPSLSEERRHRYIEAIADTTTRAAKLTSQLLAFSRRQTLKPIVFDAAASIRALGDMVVTLTGSRIRIGISVPDEVCLVNADPSQFDTALVNLAVNARDAMQGEGDLSITVALVDRVPPLRAHPARVGAFVRVAVSDTGSGIHKQDLDKIFEPFFTTKGVGKGTGLGLSQVFGFVKQSGGEVDVASQPGQGATFTLYLPRTLDAVAAAEPEADRALVDGHGTGVLVVEDNAGVGAFAVQTLGELGFRPTLAVDAAVALTLLDQDAGRFDVVFSDVVMPGMNGIDLAQEICRRHPGLPVVLTSGYSQILAQDGTHGFALLQKPYSLDELSRALQKAVRWRRLVEARTV
ncbi:PAS domain S-box protein [Lichenihabitans sp. Uapishka_5]|uniref:PAS domain S-box protein n=1 Tax=Lichenihabitans sp. Uapishka_5 TaxID=3037302 RepID=UPI0029E800D8|nr:PAS domain S-box protein [Lichenihabitans sp. Uapishka_5]MDX7950565.1 PAS domain S-box protein [Lichenihabitans sp. Uapishka_5]